MSDEEFNRQMDEIVAWVRSLPGDEDLRAEIGRLRMAIRVNGLRWGATDAEIDAVLEFCRNPRLTQPTRPDAP